MEKRKQGLVQGHGSGYGGSGFKFDKDEDQKVKAARRQKAKVRGRGPVGGIGRYSQCTADACAGRAGGKQRQDT
jgi:hypothetical protein